MCDVLLLQNISSLTMENSSTKVARLIIHPDESSTTASIVSYKNRIIFIDTPCDLLIVVE